MTDTLIEVLVRIADEVAFNSVYKMRWVCKQRRTIRVSLLNGEVLVY